MSSATVFHFAAADNRQFGSALMSSPVVPFAPQALYVKGKLDQALVRYDAWFLVFVAVLLALGATVLLGMAAWCVVKGHGHFTGHWKWVKMGVSVSMECAR